MLIQTIYTNQFTIFFKNYSLSFLILPNGFDPDSFVRKNGRNNFESLLDQKIDIGNFVFNDPEPAESKMIDHCKLASNFSWMLQHCKVVDWN